MTNPKGSKLAPKLKLDMSFDEALERFVRVTPKEIEKSIAKAKQRKQPTRGKKIRS
jgi:hypothetical protein